MSEVVCLALLTADRVITETNGKKGIIGVFSNFNAHEVPVAFPPWFVYASVTNLTGENNFSVTLTHDESGHVLLSQGGDIVSKDPKGTIDIVLQVNTIFPKFGLYTVQFNINGREVLARKLRISEAKQQPK